MKKIGILGGTLDPIHNGHLIVAQQALEQLNLDNVLIMPSGNPPHKSDKEITNSNLRFEMTKLALSDNDFVTASDFELSREGYIYTADTLKLLKSEISNADLYFILGADSLLYIDEWYKPQQIFDLCEIVVADRANKADDINKKITELSQKYNNVKIHFINCPLIDISSSEIRDKVKNNKTIKYLVPSSVENFIYKNNLYKK